MSEVGGEELEELLNGVCSFFSAQCRGHVLESIDDSLFLKRRFLQMSWLLTCYRCFLHTYWDLEVFLGHLAYSIVR